MTQYKWKPLLWLILSTILLPAVLTMSVGILILVFYREAWDVAFGVLVLCFAIFAVVGSSITVFLLRRTSILAQMQAEFLANMSHDFRTPLTSIRLFVETLRAGRVEDPEEYQRCLAVLAQETVRMERLVERVLTFRHIEKATKSSLNLSLHPPETLLEEALAPFRLDEPSASRIELVMEPELPRIMAEKDTLVEAIRNLVTNALKYGPVEGSIVVTLRADGEGVALSVRDQGPAISKQESKHIFKRFYRSPGNEQQGNGLGLAITKHAARAHGGTLELKSTRGVGNVFTLRLPLIEPLHDDRAIASPKR
jgi:two-component system phosphate regulon sensor histidine kinase PhoR